VPHDLTPGDGQDVLARFKRAREQRDPDGMLELFAPDAEYRHDPFEPPLSGSLAIREHWNRIASEQAVVEFDAERIWVSGRSVLGSWHAGYTAAGTQDRWRERGFMVVELDDAGLISRLRAWPLARLVATERPARAAAVPADAGEGQDGR
jgi:ketosteroid isomerase-like protein